jgi:hypothetical protein
MKRPKNLEHLLQVFKKVSPGAQTNWPYLHVTENIGALWEFLKSGRYKGEPRQIAYALAGVPEMSWRSSFDYCTKNPSQQHINLPAFVDHIRRHNPKCLRDLEANGVTEENRKLLGRCCMECHRLASKPKLIVRALQEGKPLIVG